MLEYDLDRPTRAECEAEEFATAVREEVRIVLSDNNPWYCRASEAVGRCRAYGPFVTSLVKRISDKMEELEDEAYDETADDLADSAALARDPYKYYGVSRKDFY